MLLLTVFSVTKFTLVTFIETEVMSPTVVGSDWSAVAAEIEFTIVVPPVPEFTVAVIVKVSLSPLSKSNPSQIPEPEL